MDAKYKKGLILGIILVALIAVFDLISMNSGLFGTAENYTAGNFGGDWWSLFFKFNLAIIVAFGLGYFFFYKQDVSETIGIILTPVILWFFGLADLLFFLFQGKWVPDFLPWLNGCVIGTISHIMGLATVTSLSLIVSVLVGFLLTYFVSRWLWRIN